MMMPFLRWLAFALTLTVCTLTLPVCDAQAEEPLSKLRLVTGGAAAIEPFLSVLAKELGYYRDAGLDVDIISVPGASLAVTAIYSGEADLMAGSSDHPILQVARRKYLKSIFQVTKYFGAVLVVSPKWTDKINTVADLQGKIVGVSSPGSGADFFLKYYLTKHGIDVKTLSTVSVGIGASSIAALEQGEIAAATVYDPAVAELEDRHSQIKILIDPRTPEGSEDAFGGPYPAQQVYGTPKWIESHKVECQKIAVALLRTLRWINSNSPEAIADQLLKAPYYGGVKRKVFVRAVAASLASMRHEGLHSTAERDLNIKILGTYLPEVRNANIDPNQLFTNEFVEHALAKENEKLITAAPLPSK
jgi:NitT/TauT family transport system substrate-binding protein